MLLLCIWKCNVIEIYLVMATSHVTMLRVLNKAITNRSHTSNDWNEYLICTAGWLAGWLTGPTAGMGILCF